MPSHRSSFVFVLATLTGTLALAQTRMNELEILQHIPLPASTNSAAAQATVSVKSLAHRAPGAARKAFRRAADALTGNNLQLAIDQLVAGIDSDPNNADAHNDAGVVSLMLGKPENAIKHFEAALKIDPKIKSANLLLGLTLVSLNRYSDEAAHALEQVKQRYPESRMALADIYMHSGKLTEANAEIVEYLKSGHAAYQTTAQAWLQLTTI